MKVEWLNKNCVLFKLGGVFERVIKCFFWLIFVDDVIKERLINFSVEFFVLLSRN